MNMNQMMAFFNSMMNLNPMMLMYFMMQMNMNNQFPNNQTQNIQVQNSQVQNSQVQNSQIQNTQVQNSEEPQINLYFIYNNKFRICIPCNPSEVLSEVISRYVLKTNDKNENYYLYNNRKLNPSKTVQEEGLYNTCVIYAVNFESIKGGFK